MHFFKFKLNSNIKVVDYCFIHYLQIEKNNFIKKSIIQKTKSKSTLNTKNQIMKSGWSLL